MAMVVVMAALVGAGLWVAIRVENGLDARPGPGRGPVRGRRCTLGHDRMTAARRHAVHAVRCRLRRDACRPAVTRPARRAVSAVAHGVRRPAGRPRALSLMTVPRAGRPGYPSRDPPRRTRPQAPLARPGNLLRSPYLRDVRGYPALYLLPMAAIVVCAPPSGRILASRGPRLPLAGEQRAYMAGGTRRLGSRPARGRPAVAAVEERARKRPPGARCGRPPPRGRGHAGRRGRTPNASTGEQAHDLLGSTRLLALPVRGMTSPRREPG